MSNKSSNKSAKQMKQHTHPSIKLKLNLGCGFRRMPGYINVDAVPDCSPDAVVDLEQTPWPWRDDGVDEVQLVHVLEHLGRKPEVFRGIMQELYRVCADGAAVHIIVPHHRHDNFYSDPTHVRPITPLGLSLLDRTQCEYWVKNGFANTPLALYWGLDFVTESVQHDVDNRWLERLNAGHITSEQLADAMLHQSNVITQTRFLLRVRKTEPPAPMNAGQER